MLLLPWLLPASPALAPCPFSIGSPGQLRSWSGRPAQRLLQLPVLPQYSVQGRSMGLHALPRSLQGPPSQAPSPSTLPTQPLLCSWPGRPGSFQGCREGYREHSQTIQSPGPAGPGTQALAANQISDGWGKQNIVFLRSPLFKDSPQSCTQQK